MGIRQQKADTEIRTLNNLFHSYKLASTGFYENIELLGINVQDSILIWIAPDSGNTFIGELLNQEKKLIRFDIDCDELSLSEIEFIEAQKKYSPLNEAALILSDSINSIT